ncbi:MAG: hypothetical protein AABW75_01315 [Nanoarchaeota archaeon]
MFEEITTIKLIKRTKERIDNIRSYKRESYDDILQKMLEILNVVRVDPDRARSRLMQIDKERELNLNAGRDKKKSEKNSYELERLREKMPGNNSKFSPIKRSKK